MKKLVLKGAAMLACALFTGAFLAWMSNGSVLVEQETKTTNNKNAVIAEISVEFAVKH